MRFSKPGSGSSRSGHRWITSILASLALAASAAPAAAGTAGAPAWAVNQPIYEINVAMFSPEGTYKGLEKRIPKLKALGVGILWLMPITTRGVERAFGSPYCVRDYKGFHAPYGSEQDFKDLVAAVHAAGLRIILDWVPNHTSWDNHLIRDHKDWYKRDAAGNVLQAYSWSDVAQLDYANAAMRAYMIDALKHWVTRYGVDGFRLDVAWGVPKDFWAQARAALDQVKPTFLLAEANHPDDQASFHSNYDWDLMAITDKPAFVAIARGEQGATHVDDILAKERRVYAAPFQRMRFTSNHDEWNNFGTPAQRLGAAARPLALLTATLPGKPLLYNGQEIGWNPSGDRQNQRIAWNDTSAWLDFYGKILRQYQENTALHSGSFTKLKTTEDASVYAFARGKDRDRVLVFLNLGGASRTFTFPAATAAADLAGPYTDLYAGGTAQFNPAASQTLGPWGYRILVTRDANTGVAVRPRGPAPQDLGAGGLRRTYGHPGRILFRLGDGLRIDALGAIAP